MTISETNLKLLKSERLTDFTDGGGKMTSAEVVDGQVNNLFNDISSLDRAYGRISLRKTYASVQTANTDTYLGAHIILTDPPDDANVNVTLFTTASWTDERADARDRIESYSIEGPESPWILYANHVVGQKMIQLWSRSNADNINTPTSDRTPEVGDVMLMSVEKTGYTAVAQYVRITKVVSRTTQKFTDTGGDFYKDILLIEISNPLRYLFRGASPSRILLRRDDADSSPTVFRTTSVADAAQYFGVKKVSAPVAINDLTINVGTPYSALVPSARAETPLIDIQANLSRTNYVRTGAELSLSASATLTGSTAPDFAANIFLPRGGMPNTWAVTIGGTAYKDDGTGVLVLANGSLGTYSGQFDYAQGKLVITKTTGWTESVSIVATPCVAVYDNAGTTDIPVTINNRAFNYVKTIRPNPAPGSVIIDYKALDKWYRLYDDGNGHINGAVAGVGTGTINYATGSVLVTLAALPDIGSSVIFAWATPVDYTIQTYTAQPPKPSIHAELPETSVRQQGFTITWMDGTLKTATSNGSGVLSGDATGKVGSNGAYVSNGQPADLS